jgi:hypothetical protein
MVWDQRIDVSRQTRISSIGGMGGFAVFGQHTPVGVRNVMRVC